VDIIQVLIISTGSELMKLIFAVLDVSRTMGLTPCYKTEVFFTFIFAVFLQYFMPFRLLTPV